jgi:hypothetical protein
MDFGGDEVGAVNILKGVKKIMDEYNREMLESVPAPSEAHGGGGRERRR